MGLIDILNGMQHGPRGQPSGKGAGSGGMSPITMAILGLLAYKAVKSYTGNQDASSPGSQRTSAPADSRSRGASTGGLGDLLGGLGGLLAGGAAGSVLSGGLNDLLKQFQQSGQGDIAKSWVGTGENREIAPDDLAKALGADKINTLTAQTGMSREELLDGLSQYLPDAVDQLTPRGRVPTEQEASRML
ncbi:MAG TPA: YidB family protein [Xanthobacteraceae bacterium]|jgi:uncharacterized protein YidB (DUF937 family)|nr:YidB family protein [Xanthobacteraceae bacterium]